MVRVKEVEDSMGLYPLRKPKQQIFISWIPPPTGWVKLNTDGCSKGNPGLASGGGLLRDEDGKWIKGFASQGPGKDGFLPRLDRIGPAMRLHL